MIHPRIRVGPIDPYNVLPQKTAHHRGRPHVMNPKSAKNGDAGEAGQRKVLVSTGTFAISPPNGSPAVVRAQAVMQSPDPGAVPAAGNLYEGLPAELIEEAEAVAGDVVASHRTTCATMAALGRRLQAIKDALPGRFLRYVDEKCGASRRWVDYCLEAARRADKW